MARPRKKTKKTEEVEVTKVETPEVKEETKAVETPEVEKEPTVKEETKEVETPEIEEIKDKIDLSDISVDVSEIQEKIILEEKIITRSNKVEINGKKFIITPDGQMIDEIEWKSITGKNI